MITRENYEEFFLLYVDNELSFTDRTLVEQFVAENPDLGEEWEALLQCRILPDTDERPVFGHKESLMRFEGAESGAASMQGAESGRLTIDGDNYEAYFLSYIDGELDGEDRQSVEEFIHRHPSKGPELERLQQTISRPDLAILFPDKKSLYKEEARRFILAPWWRVAAAAVVLGVIGWLLFYRFASGTRGNRAVPELAGTGSGTGTKKETVKKDSSPVTPAKAGALYSSGSSTVPTAAGLAKNTASDLAQNAGSGLVKKNNRERTAPIVVAEKTNGAKANAEKTIGGSVAAGQTTGSRTAEQTSGGRTPGATRMGVEKITHPEDNAIAAADPGTIADPGKTGALTDRMVPPVDRTVSSKEGAISRENSSFATQALLHTATASTDDTDDDGDEPVSAKKNKLRGIFRKVSRAFEKTADRDDNGQRKVLIGAFQVALK